MKILFLDIDGVLNSIRSAVSLGGYPWGVKEEDIKLFDQVAIQLIKRLCEKTDCQIVLSSVWRLSIGHKKLAEALFLPIVDSTPCLHMSGARGQEIKAYLGNHPEVTCYAIVDDDSDMLDEQLPYFIKTDRVNGLSYENYEQLLKLLKEKE